MLTNEAGEFDLRASIASGTALSTWVLVFQRDSTGNCARHLSAGRVRPLTDHFSLNYGAIYIILTPDGKHIFLEPNPCGEFLWLERFPGLPISNAIADVLLGPSAPLTFAAQLGQYSRVDKSLTTAAIVLLLAIGPIVAAQTTNGDINLSRMSEAAGAINDNQLPRAEELLNAVFDVAA